MYCMEEKALNEFVESSPSYIQDTSSFLQKLEEIPQPLPKVAILFCFDVVKLYPPIPKEGRIAACKEALTHRTDHSIPSDAVIEMITTVLDNNIIAFHGKEYRQTKGVAIGSRLGRNLACCYMRKWDEQLATYPEQPIFYKRFIDDGFGIWTHGEDKLQKFLDHANGIDPNIRVELRSNNTEIEFLDTLVKVDGHGVVTTDLYTKPTDKHMYVNCKSDHPNNVKKAIPYGLGIRLKRICSKEEDYTRHRQQLKKHLRKRGYSRKFVEQQLKKADQKDREGLLHNTRKKERMERVPLVLTYSSRLPDVRGIIRKNMPELQRSESMKKIFQEIPIVAYRRGRNLGDTLVHGKTNRVMRDLTTSVVRCQKKCIVCDMLKRGQHWDDENREQIDRRQECGMWNVVYGINCLRSKKWYMWARLEER